MATPPVNFRKRSLAGPELTNAAKYAIQVADHYVNWLRLAPGGPRAIEHARVLEVGPGATLGSAVLLACAGGRVTVADRFLPVWDSDFHELFFAELLRQVENRGAAYGRPIECVLEEGSFHAAIECHPVAAEHLAQLDGSFDAVYSTAVLEHVEDLSATAVNLAAITAPDGLNFHQVDLRDHRDFDRPLEYLTLPADEFAAIRHECHCECGARWRVSDIEAAFTSVGFIVETRPNLMVKAEYLADVRPRLQPEFAGRSDSDLSAISAFFSMRRSAD